MLVQICKHQLDESHGQTPNPMETQLVADLKHQIIELKKKNDEIRQLNKKWQADAKKVRKLEEEIRQKDQEFERLNRILDQNTFDSRSKQNPVSAVSAKQVCIVNTCNDRIPICILIWMYKFE